MSTRAFSPPVSPPRLGSQVQVGRHLGHCCSVLLLRLPPVSALALASALLLACGRADRADGQDSCAPGAACSRLSTAHSSGAPSHGASGAPQSSLSNAVAGSSPASATPSAPPSQQPSAPPSGQPSGQASGQASAAASEHASGGAPHASTSATASNAQAGAGGFGAAGAGPSADAGAQDSRSFPFNQHSPYCTYPSNYNNADVQAAYTLWKDTVITSDGAGGYLRVRKPDSGTEIDSTVSEGIGYGMLLAVYMNDPELFDNLWRYEQLHLNGNGLMHWEINAQGNVIGTGAASDGDEDMAWALIMADRLWGGSGTLDDSYLNYAKDLVQRIWDYEVDHTRGDMLKAGDEWGDQDITNPSYFAPAYYRLFGEITGQVENWNRVIDSSYRIIEASLNAASGNQDNGLVPAWCDSQGTPVEAYDGAPLHFQNDSTRTPFRVGQDYCYYGEPRAKTYLEKISAFYAAVGVSNIVDGYNLDGTPRPERSVDGLLAASFVGPAAVGAMFDPKYQAFVDEAYSALATLELTAGTIYYQKSWSALSLLMLSGNFFEVPPR